MERRDQMLHVIPGAAVLWVLLVAAPVAAEVRFIERNGTLYVTAAAPPGQQNTPVTPPSSSAERPAPSRGARSAAAHHYAPLIADIASRHAVPARLVESVIEAESRFNPRAVSPRGASGLMQLMPATAARLGVRDVFDARENIEGGVRHLRGLIDQYAGDLRLALAAYNAGSEAVARYRGVPPFGETQTYVRRVLGSFKGPTVIPAPASEAPVVAASSSRRLDRYEAPDGTIVYTNLPAQSLPQTTKAWLATTR
jgi:soluble lytic murein transglycosylase-like protein